MRPTKRRCCAAGPVAASNSAKYEAVNGGRRTAQKRETGWRYAGRNVFCPLSAVRWPVSALTLMPAPPTFADRLRWLSHRVGSTTFVSEFLPAAGVRGRAYAQLLRLDKPIGIWLLLWPVLWALWLSANGKPDEHVFLVFVLGTVLTRAAGCAINDFADRNFDAHVRRTRDRPLATGQLDPIEALALCVSLGLIALGLVLTLDKLTQLMAIGGAVLLMTYPFMKRFFPLPQFYLGAAFTWSVPMVFAAQTGNVSARMPWLLFISGLLWTMAYDTMYAMLAREDR